MLKKPRLVFYPITRLGRAWTLALDNKPRPTITGKNPEREQRSSLIVSRPKQRFQEQIDEQSRPT